MWNAEDEMIVIDGQKLQLSLGQPLVASASLALGTVPIAAGVVRDSLMSAAYARIAMTAEGSGTATQDRIEHLALRPGQRGALSLLKAVACSANHVGLPKGGAAHPL